MAEKHKAVKEPATELTDCPICGHDACPIRPCNTMYGPARFTVYCPTCKSRCFVSEDGYKEMDQGKRLYNP